MGWFDLLQALPRKRKIEPQTAISYMKEAGMSSIIDAEMRNDFSTGDMAVGNAAAGLLQKPSFPIHGLDQIPVLLIDGIAFHLHGRRDFTVLGIEFLVEDPELADIFHACHLRVDFADFFLN